MRVTTSVMLPSALLDQIDRVDCDRSAFRERAALLYLAQHARAERNAEDAIALDRVADELNRESDALEFQATT